jgi:DNA-binding transcriptional LysR family regulator
MNVSLRQLRVFLSVAEHRNFTRAGAQMGLSQPAVSRWITELEDVLEARLFDRTTREVELTAGGRALAVRLERVLDELDAVLLDAREQATTRRGRVRVASSPTLSANLMPQCIAKCKLEHSGIELLLLDRIQHNTLASVLSGEVDFGVVIDPGRSDDLHCEPILSEPFCLVIPREHRLAAKRAVGWKELCDQPLVLLDHASGSRRLIDEALAANGVEPVVRQEVGHPTTIFRMLEAGLGISVVPELAVAPASLGKLVARSLVPRVDRTVMLVRRKNRMLTALGEVAWQLVKDVAQGRTSEPHAHLRATSRRT